MDGLKKVGIEEYKCARNCVTHQSCHTYWNGY